MMRAQHRRSYLAPPAPQSLNRDGSRATSSSRSSHSQNVAPHETPTSGEIPLNISSEISSHGHYSTSGGTTTPRNSTPRHAPEPPLPPLEHLSLETKDMNGEGRRPSRSYAADPHSAVDAAPQPYLPRVSGSSTRAGLQTGTLPPGAPPTGPLPTPPAESRRSHPRA